MFYRGSTSIQHHAGVHLWSLYWERAEWGTLTSMMRPWMVPALCVGWLLGVAYGSVVSVPAVVLHVVLGTVAVTFTAVPQWRGRLAALAVLAAVFGVWRAQDARTRDATERAVWVGEYERPRVIRGRVTDAQLRGTTVRLTVSELAVDDRSLPGALRTTVPRMDGLQEGADVVLRGTLVRPEDLRPPGRPLRGEPGRVFERHHLFAAMRFPLVTVEDSGIPTLLTRVRLALRHVLLTRLPEPAAGLYSAFLLSFDQDLSVEHREKAAATGILHLVAISGSHISVIMGFVVWVAFRVGFSRWWALFGSLAAAAGFLALVGFPESGVRSGIMATVVFHAVLFARPASGLRALLLACALMTVQNPRILLGDVGFQLSALAVWGLLVLGPLFSSWFTWVPRLWGLRTLLVLTIAAEVATLPVVAYTFGRVPLVGPMTNLVAGFLFPVLFVAGGAVLLLGLIAPSLTVLPGALATGVAHVFLGIAELGTRLPHHVLTLPAFPLSILLGSVLMLVTGAHLLQRRRRTSFISLV